MTNLFERTVLGPKGDDVWGPPPMIWIPQERSGFSDEKGNFYFGILYVARTVSRSSRHTLRIPTSYNGMCEYIIRTNVLYKVAALLHFIGDSDSCLKAIPLSQSRWTSVIDLLSFWHKDAIGMMYDPNGLLDKE